VYPPSEAYRAGEDTTTLFFNTIIGSKTDERKFIRNCRTSRIFLLRACAHCNIRDVSVDPVPRRATHPENTHTHNHALLLQNTRTSVCHWRVKAQRPWQSNIMLTMESVSAAGQAKPQDSSCEKQGFLMLYGSQTGQSEAIAKVRHAVRARVCVYVCSSQQH
jgi:hypothetical protein